MTVASAPHLRRGGLLVVLLSLIAIGWATLLPEAGKPLETHFCLVCGSVGALDGILNVALFVPLGVGLALLGVRGRRAIPLAFALSALVETAQFFVIAGRNATIGDVLTNTSGGALGFLACRYLAVWMRPSRRVAIGLAIGWSAIWLTIQTASNFAFLPSLPSTSYYGQIARSFGDLPVFRGRVLAAHIDDEVIPNVRISDSREVQLRLERGATIAAIVLPAGVTDGIAAIVRIADSDQREILVLGQDDTSLLFGLRTGASVLRFRPLLFGLPDVFPEGDGSRNVLGRGSLKVSGRYLAREVRLKVQTTSATRDLVVRPTAAMGWLLVSPVQWFIEGTRAERLLGLLWIAALALPFGYWGAQVSHRPDPKPWTTRMAVVGLCGLCLWVGFGFIPRALGVSAASPSEWLAAVVGVILGLTLVGRRQNSSRQGARSALAPVRGA